ncbi:MAG: hypothetical protein NVS4B11_25990 [Ktedonobacteraceae bacterium]
MIANALYCCMPRLRGLGMSLKLAHSHAMLSDLLPSTAYGTDGSCINMLAPITIVFQGSSVPISRGGLPIFNE